MNGLLASKESHGNDVKDFDQGNFTVQLSPSGKSLVCLSDNSSGYNIPKGKILCRTKEGIWIPVDDESNNGVLFTIWGLFAAYDPEPGGVSCHLYIPNLVNA